MPSKNPARRSQVARIAAATRWGLPEAPDMRRELALSNLEERARQIVESWPPLSDSQRARLALLLRGGTASQDQGGAAA